MEAFEQSLQKAKQFLTQGNFSAAEEQAKLVLSDDANNLDALKMLRQVYVKQELLFDAYSIMQQVVALEPSLDMQYELAIICTQIGKLTEAKDLLESYINHNPNNGFAFLNLGHMHKAFGDFKRAEKCYFKFVALEPRRVGYALWNIADLKDRKITDKDIVTWQEYENDDNQDYLSKLLIQFSLGTVLEKQKKYDEAFEYYQKANNSKNKASPFNQNAFHQFVNNILKQKAQESVAREVNVTPIFIVGMPRSGSTLVEQILASHELVNATDELNFIGHTAATLERTGNYAKAIANLSEEDILTLRQEYLAYANEYQTSTKPYFIDKNPLNFLHIGLILKLFPEAKIIHTHRNLLDNAASVFKRYFYIGHDYSYSLANIVTFMEGYAAIMRHWEFEYPGAIFHSQYEALVESPREKIKSLLSFCQLEEQESCFTFHRQKRAVLTPSVDQVNKPINSASVNSWLRFEKGLTPYKSKLNHINEVLLSLGKEPYKSAWDSYWQQGNITSFGADLSDNYQGEIALCWKDFFAVIPDKHRVLDIATGNGAVLELGLKYILNENIEMVGVDSAQVASSNKGYTLLSEVNVEKLPFEHDHFTEITSQFGIEYSDLAQSMAEVYRVLQPGGRFQFICHAEDSKIVMNNRKIVDCSRELFKFGGAFSALSDMLSELNSKKLTGYMNEQNAESKRHKLNNELARLLEAYGDTLHETRIPELMRMVLQADVSVEERGDIMKSYFIEQSRAIARLEDLMRAALTDKKLHAFRNIAQALGFTSILSTDLVEESFGKIGVVLSGIKPLP
ncbi:sulfotransferase [Litorilituus sediminis]|uniref:Methyltransferase domain-containing protein n=1 Tax=Litorilituus sediminis TaxID=718192 RepID=A0A4P6P726_9GAMM|nr:sulfotransferase [Litorilituus sediminis]QBG37451.1 methyltransferase domain-containing protein [Litorilituus sediminis]